MKLQSYLARLIWICIAPLLLLAGLMAVQALLELERRRKVQATDLAASIAAIVDRHLGSRLGALQTLAASPALDERARWHEVYAQAQRFREAFGSHVVMGNAAGEMLLNTRVPLDAKLPPMPKVEGTAAVPTALATGRPAVGDQFMGPIVKEPMIAIAVPVSRAAVTGHVLVTVIEAAQFRQRLDELALPADWSVRLLDGNGAVIARHPERDPGHARTASFTATPASAGWTVVIDVPVGLSDRTAVRAAVLFGVIILAATIVGVVGGGVAARVLSRALESLAQEEVPSAAAASRPAPEIVEVSRIRRLLSEASLQRVAGEATLRSSEERFRRLFEQAPLPLAYSDTAGKVVATNLRFRQLFGYDQSDVPTLDAWWARAFPDEQDRAHARAVSAAALEKARRDPDELPSAQLRMTCKDGAERIVVIAWIMLDGGVLASFSDVTDRARTEEALRKSEADLREAQRLAGIGTWHWNVASGRHEWSEEVYRIYGCDPARGPLVYPQVQCCFTPQTWSPLAAAVERAVREGRAYECDAEIVRPDGSRRWIVARGGAIPDTNGQVVELHGTVQDITERKLAEAQIRKLSLGVEQSPDGIAITDLAGNIEYVNDAFVECTAHEREAVLGRNIGILRSPSTEREVIAGLWATLRAGQVWRGELVNRRRDGSEYVAATVVAPMRQADGAVTHYVSIQQDVTAARRLDAELDRHRHQLEQLVAERTQALAAANRQLAQRAAEIADLYDRAPCGYHSLALDGTILSANQTELAMLGYAREEYVGRRITEFLTPESHEAFGSRFEALHRTGRVRDLPYDLVCKDGTILPVLISADMVRDEQGRPLYNRATMVDDSERRSREQEIAAMQVELARRAEAAEAANVAKSAFLANMSHEIRTPMNGILGFAQILRRGPASAEQRERIDRINAAGEHLLAIINDILDLSKIEAGKLQLEAVDFPLDSVLDGVRSLIAEGAQRKDIALEVDYDGVPVWLNGDPTRLRQCLLNLAGNAVKFTAHGRIALRSKLVEDDGDALLVRFEVEDSGIGIAADQIDALFRPFQQVDSATTRRYGGTGLGLAITLRLAELMGGGAGVESRPGEGSRFWFTARVARAVAPRPPSVAVEVADAESALRARHGGARVLLAEDDPINQEIAVTLLTDAGLHVDVAEDGRQAVEMAGRRAYDLVLMDVQMPILDGLQATRAIRGLPGGADVPIIALTANAFDEDRRRCRDAGMSGFVVKPFEPDDLFRTILEGLEAPRQRA